MHDDWNSDCLPCESFMAANKGGNNVYVSGLESSFQSLIKSLLTRSLVKKSHRNLQNISLKSLPFHFLLSTSMILGSRLRIHKQPNFDGKTSYDTTDLSLIMSKCSNEIAERMNKGVSHGALAPFDKHRMNTHCRESVDK